MCGLKRRVSVWQKGYSAPYSCPSNNGKLMRLLYPLAALAALSTTAVFAAPSPPQTPLPAYTYADLADLSITAPVIASATIREAIRVKGAQAADVPSGKMRFFVRADIVSLIRGEGGLAPQVAYVVDVPLDSRGRAPKLKRSQVLLLARRVAGRPGEIQLVAKDAQLPWSAPLEQRVRAIVQESVRRDAPPAIARIGSAFHVMGTLPGEGETQIFVIAANNVPISLSVVRRPGQERHWGVALGEIVDESASAPAPDTLLWYRLACGLPRALPAAALNDAEPAAAQAAREDYRYVLDRLGPCARTRAAG